MINISMNYLYRITNLINNKIYIGVHKTDNIDDGYMGSGSVIKSAIRKYGIENFKKEILEFFDTYHLALAKEAELVTDEFLLREDVYNLRRGGSGGFDYINRTKLNGSKDPVLRKQFSKVAAESFCKRLLLDEELRNGYVYRGKDRAENKRGFYGIDCTESRHIGQMNALSDNSREKKKATYEKIGHSKGEKNSQFGTCWIYSETEKKSIKIKKDDADKLLLSGWRLGRK